MGFQRTYKPLPANESIALNINSQTDPFENKRFWKSQREFILKSELYKEVRDTPTID